MSMRLSANRAFISTSWSCSEVLTELGGALEADDADPAGEPSHGSPYLIHGSSARCSPEKFMTGVESSSNSAGKLRGPDGTTTGRSPHYRLGPGRKTAWRHERLVALIFLVVDHPSLPDHFAAVELVVQVAALKSVHLARELAS